MVPKFLLNFSVDRITLEKSSITGTWVCLGAVKPDHPNLTDALQKLKTLARPDSEGPLTVMVALPTDQVKTLPFEEINLTRADVVTALERQTPYDVSELCFDWMNIKTGSAIAAVARDTLNDVAVFAQELNFSAVMFVALPGGDWNNNFAIFDLTERSTNEVLLRLPPYISMPMLENSPKMERVLSAKPQKKPADIAKHFATRPLSIQKPLPKPRPVDLANQSLDSTAQSTNSIPTSAYASHPSAEAAKAVHSATVKIGSVLNPIPDTTAQNTKKLLISPTGRINRTSYKENKLFKIVTWVSSRQKLKNIKTIPSQKSTKKLMAEVGGKPRYLGVLLTTLLITFMLTVAAWATTGGRAPKAIALNLLQTAITLPELTIIAIGQGAGTIPDNALGPFQAMSILSKNFNTATENYPKVRPISAKLQNKRAALSKFYPRKLITFRPVSRQTTPIVSFLTELAIATSLRPEMRPDWIEVANRAPVPTVSISSGVQASTAKSGQSVMKAATIKNILNLQNINLIGVSGKKRNLNALVRLTNGRVIQLEIGDRLNGGRVTNIQAKTLTYAKSGRSIILLMPSN